MKQQKESEPQNELLKALKKRKTSTEQSSSTPEKSAPTETLSPTEKPPVVLESTNAATGSSQEDSQVCVHVWDVVLIFHAKFNAVEYYYSVLL